MSVRYLQQEEEEEEEVSKDTQRIVKSVKLPDLVRNSCTIAMGIFSRKYTQNGSVMEEFCSVVT